MDSVKLKNYEVDITKPPIPPPCRTMKETFFAGLIETEESKQKSKDWQEYISLYGYRIKS